MSGDSSMYSTTAWGKVSKDAKFEKMTISRNIGGPDHVTFDVHFCGICHTDVNFANNPGSKFPLVPGHELAGVVTVVGSGVTDIAVGDHVGVGCISESCISCEACQAGEEHACEKGFTFTCNSDIKHGHIKTEQGWSLGGFSAGHTVHRRFIVKIPKNFPLSAAGPIMCSGISPFSPLKRYGAIKGGMRIGIVGIGGLGQMGVALAAAMDNQVTAISSSANKEEAAKKLGANKFLVWSDPDEMKASSQSLDLIINTVSADHQIETLLPLLARGGTIVQLGIVQTPHTIHQNPLIFRRLSIAGSMIGGMPETQQVMDFCHQKNIQPIVEVITSKDLDRVFEDMSGKNSQVRRFVLDVKNSL